MKHENNQQAARELLPCPWCGGIVSGHVSEGSTFRWRKVDGCCADGPEIRHDTMADDQAAAEVESTQRAIDAWNERASQWLPIESAPKDGRYVLLYTSVGTHTGYFTADRWWVTADCAIHKSHRVTHWQPLPAPPRPTQERSE